MNYANLLARGLLILYCTFLLLFAFGEGIFKQGYIHAIPAVAILALMIIFQHKPVLSFLVFFCVFLYSVWFFRTYDDVINFLVISAPLLVVSILFLVGKRGASPKSHNKSFTNF